VTGIPLPYFRFQGGVLFILLPGSKGLSHFN